MTPQYIPWTITSLIYQTRRKNSLEHEGSNDVIFFFIFRALAAEQGNPIPERPIIFFKPTTSYIVEGQSILVNTNQI